MLEFSARIVTGDAAGTEIFQSHDNCVGTESSHGRRSSSRHFFAQDERNTREAIT